MTHVENVSTGIVMAAEEVSIEEGWGQAIGPNSVKSRSAEQSMSHWVIGDHSLVGAETETKTERAIKDTHGSIESYQSLSRIAYD